MMDYTITTKKCPINKIGPTKRPGQSVPGRILLTILLLLLPMSLLTGKMKYWVIDNPQPTMVEKTFRKLEVVKTFDGDMGDKGEIFQPFSMVLDKNGDMFIYDTIQAKIFVLDKDFSFIRSFGRKGRGPGEFLGKPFPVYLNIGLDGRLYANDVSGMRVAVYDKNGKSVTDFKPSHSNMVPMPADKEGRCISLLFEKGNRIVGHSLDGKKLFTITGSKDDFGHLFFTPRLRYSLPCQYQVQLTGNGKTLIYLHSSATLLVLEKNKLVKRIHVWPKELLKDYEMRLAKIMARKLGKMIAYLLPFMEMVIDPMDHDHVYFFRVDETKSKKGMGVVYKINLDGRLVKALFIDPAENYTQIKAVRNGLYYGMDQERIVVYKEMKRQGQL